MSALVKERLVATFVLAVFGIPFVLMAHEFLAVDSCLDLGGSYDYAARVCDMVTSHPPQPSWLMHPIVAVVTGGGVLVGLTLLLPTFGVKKHGL
jgi:hypothetical protein